MAKLRAQPRDVRTAIKVRQVVICNRYSTGDLNRLAELEEEMLFHYGDNSYQYDYKLSPFDNENYRYHKQYWLNVSEFRIVIKEVTLGEDNTFKVIFKDI